MDLTFKNSCESLKTTDRLSFKTTDRLKFDIETKQDVDTSFDLLQNINYKIKNQTVSVIFIRKTPKPD